MKYIQPMNCEEFAQHLLTLKDGDEICFACHADKEEECNRYDLNNAEDWYFARVMYLPEYGSRFILIDYCGGEEAFAIPLNCYANRRDEDDCRIVPKYIKKFFNIISSIK